MTKNTGSQVIGAQITTAADGTPFTGSVTCYVTVDGGTQAVGSVGSGACTHEGGGYHTYAPSQAETNGDLLAFQFRGTGAITTTVQVFTTAQPKGTTTLATASALQTVDDEIATIDSNVDTLLTRITASLFTGITSLAEWMGLIAGKQTGNSTARTELRATGAGSGTFDETTDSQEALRDRGDAAWTTATGFSTHSAADVWAVGTRVLTAGTNISLAKGTGVTGFNDLSAADVNAEVDTALADIHLDHLLAATYDPSSKPGAADALLNELVENDGGVARFTANALEEAPTGGSAPTVTQIADEVQTRTIAAVTTVGSVTGAVGSVTGNVGGNVVGSVASVTAGVTLADDAITAAKFDESTAFPITSSDSGATRVARTGADADTLETLSDEVAALATTVGVDGAGLTEAGGTGDHLTALATAAALQTVDNEVGTIDTVVDAIKVITDALGSTGAARLALSAGQMIPGTVDTTVAATTTVFEADDITEATADHYIGRVIIFTSGALSGQATTITDYALNGGRGQFTVTALTEAPANDVTFLIV